ncbi:YbaB/EbfC family nucleoid-associated protein [Microbacterium sp. YY-03]|uniref:YbaB/EbfC family nucleoid-associated protein n=1 Tax=Microbacterium sp. YY-03 TaxID=3421636 RepID=UPI003D170A2E
MIDDITEQVQAARERVYGQIEDARARHTALREAINEVRGLTATVRSPRGEVSVTAAMSGAVTDVRVLHDDLDARTLSALLTQTVAAAQQAVREQAADRMMEVAGADSSIIADLRTPLAREGGL